MLMLALFVVSAVLVIVPVIAILVVSIGSRLEDTDWTLGGPATGSTQAAARRVLGYRRPFRLRQPPEPAAGQTRPREHHLV